MPVHSKPRPMRATKPSNARRPTNPGAAGLARRPSVAQKGLKRRPVSRGR